MSRIPKNEVILRPRPGFFTLWILRILDVELDELSAFVPHRDEYRVLLWFEGKEESMMMTGASRSIPNPIWDEEFLHYSYDPFQQYEYLNLEVIKKGKEPGTSHGFGVVARVRVALPNDHRRRCDRFTLVGTCESSDGCKSVGSIRVGMEKRIGRRRMNLHGHGGFITV